MSLVATNPHHVKIINSEKKIGLSIELPLPKKNRGKPFRQILAALIANLGTINVGFAFGFSAVANPQLMAPDSVLRITKEQASWVGKSVASFVCPTQQLPTMNVLFSPSAMQPHCLQPLRPLGACWAAT